ncbi:hypothetical protein M440DRAFT_1398320 [Trichoderma longibrachiatum ATCC 18648]|uniref:Uncharacterized protein n=1 Tax=Trichoderma longibrachiatum ATCC 18648 TaxID=983965 RepID=A0A2T4CBZ9_TRILO|nr:hypothetical protein M440DRAFT_1398320 [Trichoderma longibrachiatum ATCC 18648]
MLRKRIAATNTIQEVHAITPRQSTNLCHSINQLELPSSQSPVTRALIPNTHGLGAQTHPSYPPRQPPQNGRANERRGLPKDSRRKRSPLYLLYIACSCKFVCNTCISSKLLIHIVCVFFCSSSHTSSLGISNKRFATA